MPRRTSVSLPAVARVLSDLGDRIRLARQRRRLPAQLVAERAGMSRPTLRAIERGDQGVTLGAVANVLHTIGLLDDLGAVANSDVVGRKLEDARLGAGRRARGGSA